MRYIEMPYSNLKISIITAVLNNKKNIEDCIESISNQTYPYKEHIIIDGGSEDGTVDIIKRHERKLSKWISEPDNGIYDAMNKGISLAIGDIIGILNSDDIYLNEFVLSDLIEWFKNEKVDAVYADVIYVDRNNVTKAVRYYDSSRFSVEKLCYGIAPAHPTFFVRKAIYQKYGLFKPEYKISADFELLARFLGKHAISFYYIPKPIIRMRTGGTSTKIINKIKATKEIKKACAENGIQTNYFKLNLRYVWKLSGYFKKRSNYSS